MAAELPRPGVEVIQVFSSTSPTVVTPTLVPCIVGVCRQEVDVLIPASSGSGQQLNTAAAVPLPAQFVALAAPGTPPAYTGLDGLNLTVAIDNNPNVLITFSGNSLTPAQVVAEVAAAFAAQNVTNAIPEVVGTSSWRLRTVAADQFQVIEVIPGVGITDPAVMAAFGIGPRMYEGHSGYDQHGLTIAQENFPNPNNNLSQLAIESDSIRVFLYLGGTVPQLKELLKTQAFLRNGLALPAKMTFTGDLAAAGVVAGLAGQTLVITFNGAASPLTVTFGSPATPADVVSEVQAVVSSVAVASLDSTGKFLVLTTIAVDIAGTISVPTGTAVGLGFPVAAAVGVTAALSISAGNGQTVTPYIQFPGQNFTSAATAAEVVGDVAITSVTDGETLILDDGYSIQTITFSGATTPTLILQQINDVVDTSVGGNLQAALSGSFLSLTNANLGVASQVSVVGGTALTALGLTVGSTFGSPFPPMAGDALYINGVLFATIVQVAPGGQNNVLKINTTVPINSDLGQSFYILAQNLTNSALWNITRPIPNLQIDLAGEPIIQPDILRDTQGNILPNGTAQLYIAYSAIREDVTALATNPGLLQYSDTTTLGNDLPPLDATNPLALGMYFALLNSPGVTVTGIGVDAISSQEPFGTVEAFTTAATFLESYEVYAIAPMTHDPTVAQVFNTHVTTMSQPQNKGERICLINPSMPTAMNPTLVASGTDGNSGATTNTFDTGVQNLDALLLAAGVNPVGIIPVSSGLYLSVVDSPLNYAIIAVSGSVVTLQTSGFLPGQNDDSFYATSTISGTYVEEAWSVNIRGAKLVLANGQPDKANQAATLAGLAQAVQNRRYWQISPDKCGATVAGLEQVIDGFYMCAAIAGMIGQQPPQQSFTNFPMTGFTQVIGSNGYFSESQLNQMAGGGCYIVVQDTPGAPLISRMALTTDLTSIETRTDSITKVVDFCAKFLRTGLKNFIGRFNITQGFLDSLSHVIQGLLGFLAESGVLIGSTLNNIVQDASAPDTVMIDVTLDVPFPCNYIILTLVV